VVGRDAGVSLAESISKIDILNVYGEIRIFGGISHVPAQAWQVPIWWAHRGHGPHLFISDLFLSAYCHLKIPSGFEFRKHLFVESQLYRMIPLSCLEFDRGLTELSHN
jgi:hypothetical protein